MNIEIKNEQLSVEISTFGAELQKIVNLKNGENILWNGDSTFWGRRAPVLFPFVGALKNKEYHYQGRTYEMGQHGFARDMEFTLVEKDESSAEYELVSNAETKQKYPFDFCFRIGYELVQNRIKVKWKVENRDTQKMYFSIGAHPAFCVPAKQRNECYLKFDAKKVLDNTGLENGLAKTKNTLNGKIDLLDGYLKITPELFKQDALIFENEQVKEVSLCMPDKKEYVTVKFDAPLVGVWSPYKENCPFVCIEPWFGRCDAVDFEGNLEDRKWQQVLEVGEQFEKEYQIVIH